MVTIAIIFLAGCKASPERAASVLDDAARVYSLEEAFLLAPSTVEVGVDRRLAIAESSPLVSVEEGNSGFQRLQLTAQRAQRLRIEVQSFCDCIGLGKYIMVPRLFLKDHQGVVVESPLLMRRYRKPGWVDNASIVSAWEVQLQKGVNTMLLVADTRAIGSEVTQITTQMVFMAGAIAVPLSGTAHLVAYPFGKYEVQAESAK